MIRLNLLKEAHEWVMRGFEISYLIIDQIENDKLGYEIGDVPRYTYTFSIHEGFENEVWYYSVDSLEEGFTMAMEWLKKNRTFRVLY